MKKTLSLLLIGSALFTNTYGATDIGSIQNNSSTILAVTLEASGRQTNFTVKPGEKTGSIQSAADSTIIIKTDKKTITIKNAQINGGTLTIGPDSGF